MKAHHQVAWLAVLAFFTVASGAGTVLAQAASPVIDTPAIAPPAMPAPAVSNEAKSDEVKPDVVKAPAAPLPAVLPVANVPADSAKGDEKPVKNTNLRSLFLSQQDHVRISNAIADYQNMLTAQKKAAEARPAPIIQDVPKPEKQPDVERYFTYPQFFLSLLEYHSPEDWIVIVNGQKFTPQTPEKGVLSLLAIDNEKILLKWKPVDMTRVIETWDKRPVANDDKKPEMADNPMEMQFNGKVLDKVPDSPVIVDKERRLVTFCLRPNQTFSSFAMRVLEGKVSVIKVDNLAASSHVAPLAEAKKPKPDQAVDDSVSGLNGLIKAMEKQNRENKP